MLIIISCQNTLPTTYSFVPAESAEIGTVDKILVKSNSQDSVSQVRSTVFIRKLSAQSSYSSQDSKQLHE